MEYYGAIYTLNGENYISAVEGVDHSMTIAPLVWKIGSINTKDFTMMKYMKRSQRVIKKQDTELLVRLRPTWVEGEIKINGKLFSRIDKLLADCGLSSQEISSIVRKITEISEDDSLPTHNPSIGECAYGTGEWISLRD